ncbi:hypothetical protein ACLBXM_01975 [Xanthobacteraceae bacterium A53D]
MTHHPTNTRTTPPRQSPGRRGRMRSFTAGGKESQIDARLAAYEAFAPDDRQLALALRTMRRAARSGASHYDPARHAALCRMARRRSR